MMECYHCGIMYQVDIHEDFDDAELIFCPFCGEEQEEELDFEDE